MRRRLLLCGLALSSVIGSVNVSAVSAAPAPPPADGDVVIGGGWEDPLTIPETVPPQPALRYPNVFPYAVAPAGASRYFSIAPQRILDSRKALGTPAQLNARQTVRLAVAGAAGVPANATAVVLNVTITGARESGYVTAYPTGQPQPEASVINVERPGQTVANLVTVPLGTGGSVELFSFGAAHLLADVQGYYVAAASSTAGRLQPLGPTRILDTRSGVKVPAGGEIELNVAQAAGLVADTDSVAIKVTVTDATAAGYWTVYPSDTTRPDVSNVNVDQAGAAIANQAIVRLTGGRLRIFSETGGHVIVDIVGAFTGPSAPSAVDGLFVPVTPNRLLDTRQGLSRFGFRRTVEVPVASRAGVPATGAAAVVVNATFAEAAAGFGSIWPARTYRPNSSSINTSTPGQTIASHVITPVSTAGFAVYSSDGGQVIVDISGWYVGNAASAALPAHVPFPGTGGPAEAGAYTYLDAFTPSGIRSDVVNPAANVAPVRWNPCRPIRYAINLGGYPASYRNDIEESLDRIASATGISFVYAGESTFIPQSAVPFDVNVFNYRNQADVVEAIDGLTAYDLVITLGNETVSDAINGGIIGRAAPIWAYYGSLTPRYVHSSLIIDVDDVSDRGVWSGYGVGQVLLHELAHVVGLGHIQDGGQIMQPAIAGLPSYGGGDLRGLWQVGAARGCV